MGFTLGEPMLYSNLLYPLRPSHLSGATGPPARCRAQGEAGLSRPRKNCMRTATVERKTRETEIAVSLDLDGTGDSDIDTGIGFLDHMLESFSRHSMIDLKVRATGDLHV